ncbi:MAG: hypothetical protein RLZZ385_375 [Pseudomonadota bacterium]|jgi:NAD(P)-dependent dehydrogenase (short-subunit alcohol dehydrogenase family)
MATVLITGTNRGLGLEFVTRYLDRGDRVIATCRNLAKADQLRDQQGRHADGQLLLLELDVASPDTFDRFARQVQDHAIDVFINNAGVYGPRQSGFGKVTAQDWLPVLMVNSVAPLLLTQVLIDSLRNGQGKKLVYITSKMGSIDDNTGGGSYIYRSSKTALNQVVRSLSVDLAGEGFTVAVLHPGWVLTDMGGPNALIDTHTSVQGMMAVIDSLGPTTNGRFFNYDGREIPW